MSTGSVTDLLSDGTVWLDVSRLVSRIGRGHLTGIDRVEKAYLEHLLDVGGQDTRFLCRTTRGFLLLGRDGGRRLLALATGETALGAADLWSKLTFRGQSLRHRTEAALRPLALDRCLPWRLGHLLRRAKARPGVYINTGHANLSEKVLAHVHAAGTSTIIMVHDLIPITHPDTVSPGLPDAFAGRIDRVRRYADMVLCNSNATRDELKAFWTGLEPVPPIRVARLGLDPIAPVTVEKNRHSFVMLGTLEPRKNHSLMLDVWEILSQDIGDEAMPELHIIGEKGWRVDDLSDRIATHPLKDKSIFWHGAISDHETWQRLAAGQALLFPSLAEGFGYPPLEALAVGTLPIVSDLPALRETLGPRAVYVPVNDAYSWVETIKKNIGVSLKPDSRGDVALPTWNDHFSTVGAALAEIRAGDAP